MEDTIYQSRTAKVTATLVRIGGASYPVNGIGSVRIEPNIALGYLVLAAGAFILGLAQPDFKIICNIVAFGCAIGALRSRAKLVIRTASGDQTALTAIRASSLTPVMEAIERAVELRG